MKIRLFWMAILLIAVLATVSLAAAQAQNGYSIDWWTVDGGGGTSAGTGYSLSGTIGQLDAGAMSGGGYTLTGGYWGAVVASSFNVYLPLAVRGGN